MSDKTVYHIQRLQVLRADIIHPCCLSTIEVTDSVCDITLGNGQVHPYVPHLCFLNGGHVSGIEEILNVFLFIIPKHHQLKSTVPNCPYKLLVEYHFPFLGLPDGLPESL